MVSEKNVQRINFIEVMPVRYERFPTLTHVLIIWVILGVFLYFLHTWSKGHHGELLATSNALQSDLDDTISFLGRVHKDKSSNAEIGKIVAVTDTDLNLNTDGYFNAMLVLAKYGVRDVWFTSLDFDQEKDIIRLSGKTSSPKSLNKFFQEVKNDPSFISNDLVLRNVKRVVSDDDKKVLHDFSITGSFE